MSVVETGFSIVGDDTAVALLAGDGGGEGSPRSKAPSSPTSRGSCLP